MPGGGSGTDQVLAVPALVRSRPDDVAKLASLIGQPVDACTHSSNAPATTTSPCRWRTSRGAAGDAVTAAGITGCSWSAEPGAATPPGAVLGPVLGFAGIATPTDIQRWPDLPAGEIVGRAGLEQQYDSVLRGVNGRQCVYVSPPGIPVAMGERVEPVRGADLRLSLDLGLQERLSAGLVDRAAGPAGTTATSAPPWRWTPERPGPRARERPVVRQQRLRAADRRRRGAGAAAGAGPSHARARDPGGTSARFDVQAGGGGSRPGPPGDPPEKVIPTGADYTLGGHTFGNWKPMGPMDLVQSIAWSNDVYFYKLANALGPEPIIDAAHALGVGKRTGIDLPGESPGYIGTPESVAANGGTWYGGSTVILGIGQGYLTVTPLQNALWTAGVATGQLVTPRLGMATGPRRACSRRCPPRADTGAVRRQARPGPRRDARGGDRRYRAPGSPTSLPGGRQDGHGAGRQPPRRRLRQLDDGRGTDRRSRDRGDRAGAGAGRRAATARRTWWQTVCAAISTTARPSSPRGRCRRRDGQLRP